LFEILVIFGHYKALPEKLQTPQRKDVIDRVDLSKSGHL
jgi:hypothetical protein